MALKSFRKFGNSRASSALMLILVLCFGAWGIGGYLSKQFSDAAVTVGHQDIALKEVDNAYRNRLAAVTQMLGGQPPSDDMKKQLGLPRMVLEELVNRSLLQQASHRLALAPSTRQLRDELAKTPMFQVQGHFDGARYKAATAQIGLTTAAYERLLAQDLGVRLLSQLVEVAPVSSTAQVGALSPLLDGENTAYQLETFTLSPAGLSGLPTPDDKALQAFYEANKQQYAEPEKRSIAVITLNAQSISGTISIPESQIKDRFEQNKAAYAQPEKRHVRHILVADAKDAVAIRGAIHSEADFIKLAKQKSIDPGSKAKGGDLGEIAESDVVPAFGKVAFSEPVGQVSIPVKSPFGWHLIWVESITPAGAGTLASAHDRIKAELVSEQTDNALQGLLRQVDDRAAGGDSLEKIASATGLAIKRYGLLTAGTNTVEPALVQAAFAAEQGSVAGPVTLPDGSLAYLEITTIVPAKTPPLADIADRVRKDLRSAQLQTELQKQGLALISQGKAAPGAPLSALAAAAKIAGTQGTLAVGADMDSAPDWLHPALISLFSLPAGGMVDIPLRNGENQVVVRLTKRDHPAQPAAERQSAAATYRKQLQQDVEAMTLRAMQNDTRVSFNAPLLKQVFGADWTPPGE
jgi:peptidyl-prolyl cis-trans isomerase D